MDLKEAIIACLTRRLISSQDVETIVNNVNLDYNLPSREYEIVHDNDGVKYFKTIYKDKEYGTEIEIYFSVIKGSLLDENYNSYSILVEEYLLDTRDYEYINYSCYRIDGIVEKHKVYCNEEKNEEPLLRRLNKLRSA